MIICMASSQRLSSIYFLNYSSLGYTGLQLSNLQFFKKSYNYSPMNNRGFLSPRSETILKESDSSMKEVILEKDRQISQLQSALNKLELKSKQSASYEEMILQYESRVGQLEKQIYEKKQQARQKNSEAEHYKQKIKQIQLKNQSNNMNRDMVKIKKQTYQKMANQIKQLKEKSKQSSTNQAFQDLEDKNRFLSAQCENLEAERKHLLEIINTKNLQILNLKPEDKAGGNPHQFHEVHYDAKQLKAEIDRLIMQLQSANAEKQEYRQKAHNLEYKVQEYVHTSSEWSTHSKNIEYLDKIQQYQQHIESMASKLSSIHKIQMEKNTIQKERRQLKTECGSLQQENNSLKHYIDHLQQKIRKIQQYGENYLEIDMQKFIMGNNSFSEQLQGFFKRLGQKEEQLSMVRQNYETIHKLFNEEIIMNLGNTLDALEASLKQTQQRLHEEQQKVFKEEQRYLKLQKELKNKEIEYNEIKSELGKINRVISQKMQKIEFQSVEIKRLENQNREKLELSEKCAKLQKTIVKLQNELDQKIDENTHLLMSLIISGTEIDRLNSQDKVSGNLLEQIESLNAKAHENSNNAKIIEERITRLEHLHKCVVEQSNKISQHLHMSHKRWNHYDQAMQGMTNFLEKTIQRTDKTFQQMDEGIEQNIKRHEKIIQDFRRSTEQEEQKLGLRQRKYSQSRSRNLQRDQKDNKQ